MSGAKVRLTPLQGEFKQGLRAGAKKGWSSFVWICKILVPASFVVTMLQWGGLLYRVEPVLAPLMRLINLPGQAALPIITGMLIGNYAAIAVITALPLNLGQMTLIVVFSLIAHNLIVEGLIQHRSGINMAKITVVRIATAILTVFVVSQFFTDTTAGVVIPSEFMNSAPFTTMLKTWAVATGGLLLKILAIIMGVVIGLELLRVMGWMSYLIRFFRPVMKILGLSDQTSTLWMMAALFGLTLGGAVIVEEAKRGTLTGEELERLHISIGINHSMVEDPALFLALGIDGLWLWLPKLVAGIVAVQVYRVARYLRGRLARRPAAGSQ
jgi:spore maturation protein SpmB